MQCQICGRMVDDSNEREWKKHSLGAHLKEIERLKEITGEKKVKK